MFLQRFYEPSISQVSYLIGCASAGVAIVIDPHRDVGQYLDAADAQDVRIVHVTETHIHADFVSGMRELAARTGATMYVSREGGPDWQYAFTQEPHVVTIADGDRIAVGKVRIEVVHTPGHTPEHVTFLVTDTVVAEEPVGAVTGDFLFVGDVGRPDLLERAVQVKGAAESSARALYRSVRAFAARPDWLQIWPGHGAGSACGKGISAMPQSTLGYERRFNWAFQANDEDDFVREALTGQPDPPTYFARMKRVNKAGPPVLGSRTGVPRFGADALRAAIDRGAFVVDARPPASFAVGHLPGTLNIPRLQSFLTWAGWLAPYDTDLLVIVDDEDARAERQVGTIARDLSLIGFDRVVGYGDRTTIDEWAETGGRLDSVAQIGVRDLAESVKHGGVALIDVREPNEFASGHIPGARQMSLGTLGEHLGELPARTIAVQCQGGGRSSIAASLLRARGVSRVVNVTGGLAAWIEAGGEIQT